MYMLFIFPEIPRLVHPCYLGRMGAPVHTIPWQVILFQINLSSFDKINFEMILPLDYI